jgi:hypothetical protein
MAVAVPVNNKVDVAGITKKWHKWLRGIKTEEKRTNLAILLENQHVYNTNSLLKEATVSGDAGAFQKVILPVIRRVFPRLVAPELVGVQPMTGPTGLAIFLKYFYESAAASAGSPAILQPQGAPDGRRIYMRAYESGPFLEATKSGSSPLGAVTLTAGDYVMTTTFGSNALILPGNATTTPATGQQYSTWSGSAKFSANVEVTLANSAGVATGLLEVENQAAYGASAPSFAINWTQFTGPSIAFNLGTAAPAATGSVVVKVPTDFTSTNLQFVLYAFDDSGNANANPDTLDILSHSLPGQADAVCATFTEAIFLLAGCPVLVSNGMEQSVPSSLSVKFETHPIVAEDFKLQATWSLEAAQDVNALQGESLEEVLSNLLTQELMNEIDYLVLMDLLNMAGIAATWNKYPGTTPVSYSAGSGFASGANAVVTSMPSYRGSLKEWWETLPMLMNDVANSIHTRILRGPANFAVCSPDVSTVVESLPDFKSASINDLDTEVGIVPVGTLTSKYKLYKDARLAKGTLLMGYKGQDSRNTGYIYSPYVPATLSPIIWDPVTYNNKRMIMTRFGRTTLLDGQFFYARIRVTESSNTTSDWMSA